MLSQQLDVAIPDLRCFGDTEDLPVDATRGYRDWTDDMTEFVDALGWKEYSVLGWSMGGDIAMQLTIDHPDQINHLILLCCGSPYGFGGSWSEDGTFHHPLGLGAGGGCAKQQKNILLSDRASAAIRKLLYSFYFNSHFHLDEKWEQRFIDSVLKTKTGEGRFPGDFHYTIQWPFITAGEKGVLNTMAPPYCDVSGIMDISPKPPILWLRGSHDSVVSDKSMFEFGYLGSIGMVPGWPGPIVYPPQPMESQIRHVLNLYQEKGGAYNEIVIPGGHACHLESPEYVIPTLFSFILD
jgi:pimeloyl-ACP methyl ester carboxylesterase